MFPDPLSSRCNIRHEFGRTPKISTLPGSTIPGRDHWAEVYSGLFTGAGVPDYLRTDSASFLSERQRILSFSAFQADSASPRFVSAHTASRDPPVTLPPLHLLSVAQRFEVL